MRVLVLGGTGMLGHKMFQVLDKSFDTYVTFRRDGWSRYPIYQDIDEDHTIDGIDVTDFGTVAYVFGHDPRRLQMRFVAYLTESI